MAIKNMAASVLARLKNQSKEEGIPFQMVLQLFAQEEFLRKLSLSKYADNLILKGGMFIYTLTEFDSRLTRDIDFLVNFEGTILDEAVKCTLSHRNRALSDDVFTEIADFKNNKALNTQWKAFDPAKESGLSFDDVLDRLAVFLEPIYQNILRKTNFEKRWSHENKMWM